MWQWDLLKEVAITSLVWPQANYGKLNSGKLNSSTHQWKIGLKIYQAWPHPSEQDPDSPAASLSDQGAPTSLLNLPSEGRQTKATITEN